MGTTMTTLFATAIHEPGHAVAALRLGARVESVEIGEDAASPSTVNGVVRVGVTRLAAGEACRMRPTKYLVYCLAGEAASSVVTTPSSRGSVVGTALN
jgi:hypothetical protein